MIVLYLLAAAQAVAAIIVLARLTRGKDRPKALRAGPGARPGSISIVIPARNEADRIRPLLTALLQTTSTVREVIVIDDRSKDKTASVVAEFSALDERIRVVRGKKRKRGWVGKQHALQQGLLLAEAPWTLCLDADTCPDPALPDALLHTAEEHGYDVVSAGPRFAVDTAGEAMLHPALLATLVYRFGPPTIAPVTTTRMIANGQCLLVPTARFRLAGGWEPVAANMTEDVALARHLVRSGWKLGMANAAPLLLVDMHASTREAWREWGRSIALPGVASGREQFVDSVVLLFALALPPWMLVAAILTQNPLIAIPALVLIAVRLLFQYVLRPNYDNP
ncbi:MAG: glycosyltransferase family 2 protein, partial [bacterium]